MPEHYEERLQFERRLQVALRRCNQKMRTRLMASMGSPPDPRNIPQTVWEQVELECAEDPIPLLMRIYQFAFTSLAALFGYLLVQERFLRSQAENQRQMRRRLQEMARRRMARIRQKLAEKSRDAAKQGEPVDWGVQLDKQIGLPQNRDSPATPQEEATACTETTEQISRGELDYVGHVEAEVGFRIERTWRTERDTRVCPICSPLHKTPSHVWEPVSPGGPPAHVRCRCWLIYTSDRSVPGIPDGEIGG